MKLAKELSVGLVALATIAFSAPNVEAHNPAKYTNVPFVVASNCPNINSSSSVSWVSVDGTTQLQVNTVERAVTGFEVFCSSPSSNSNPATALGTIPVGTYSFNITGSTSSISNIEAYSVSSTDAHNTTAVTTTNGVATVTIPTPSSGSLVAVQFEVNTTSSSNVTVNLSNFRVNNSSIALDTTQTDMSTPPDGYSCFYPCALGNR